MNKTEYEKLAKYGGYIKLLDEMINATPKSIYSAELLEDLKELRKKYKDKGAEIAKELFEIEECEIYA